MNALDQEVLEHAHRWLCDGRAVHLVTVVQTWGSSPRQAGALLALRDDGRVAGSVSGGCVEDDLIARAQAGDLPARPACVTYGVTRDEAARFGLPCGGTLRLMVEPLRDATWLAHVLAEIRQHRLTRRTLDLVSGDSQVQDAQPGDVTQLTGDIFQAVYGPRWRLLIIGANQTARVLATMAAPLEFQVLVCDPREEITGDWDVPGTTWVPGMPDDAVIAIGTDHRTAIVAVTHDPKLDDMALLEALKSPAFYVGALGSKANQAKRRDRLRLFDLTDEEIDRLHGPVGLPIASRTPAEIAVAIAAELVLVRNTAGVSAASASCPSPAVLAD